MVKKIILVKPSGLCAGVERSLLILDLAIKDNPGPIYCKHEIVHNQKVVTEYQCRGVIFVEDLTAVPDGATVVFSAHGTSPKVYEQAQAKQLKIIDAACPLVIKVHNEAKAFSQQGYQIVYLGHKNHPEAIGVLGEVKEAIFISNLEDAKKLNLPAKAALLTQTTLSLDETRQTIDYLKAKWPQLILPVAKDICFATTNRQTAVKALGKVVDLVLVVGSKNSSNSNRLREAAGKEAYLIDGPEDLKTEWFDNKTVIGITAGASVPQKYVEPVIRAVQSGFGGEIEELEIIKEAVKFRL